MNLARTFVKAVLRSPAGRPLQSIYTGVATCLMYHRIVEEPTLPHVFAPNRDLFVTEEEFGREMKYISQQFRCLSLDEAVEQLRRGTIKRRSVVVTFDDGHKDNLTLGLPILERYNVPATIYVTTGIVDETACLWWYEHEEIVRQLPRLEFEWEGRAYTLEMETKEQKRLAFLQLNRLFKSLPQHRQEELLQRIRRVAKVRPLARHESLTWDDIRTLDRHPLITIGAHTIQHLPLSQLTDAELAHELCASKRQLEEQLGHEVRHFAYPFGEREHAGAREFRAAQEAGFVSAATTRPGHWFRAHRDHLYALPRIGVDAHHDHAKFLWQFSGFDVMLRRPFRRFIYD